MKGTISKIHPLKKSRNGNSFQRVEFKLENGNWAVTDLCPDFRNYSRWKSLLEVGKQLDGLDLKSDNKVNADSFVKVYIGQRNGYWEQGQNGGMRFVLTD